MPVLRDIPNSYYIRTFGCQMNLHDSEHIAGVLEQAGYRQAPSIEESGIVIFNTCSVRESAESRVWGNIGAVKSMSGMRKLAVCGCMAERLGEKIIDKTGCVDLVFGMAALGRLPELLQECDAHPVCEVGQVSSSRIDILPAVRRSGVQAWVPVSHGCDNNCAYCVVPSVRGAQVSRPSSEVVREVERLAAVGTLEVILLGQNVNSYGSDTPAGARFADLLISIAAVEGIRRVKFETSHPVDLSDDILEAMAGAGEVCEYMHLPVQSGSDRVLRMMYRRHDREFYIGLARKARSRVPGLTLTTDAIVGFPTETDEDFEMTYDLFEEVGFDAAYLFLYSSRDGTPAALLEGEVPDRVKRERFARLSALQDARTAESLDRLVGTTQQVLIEGASRRGGLMAGRTRGHRVVLLEKTRTESRLLDVKVTSAGKHALRGAVIDHDDDGRPSDRE